MIKEQANASWSMSTNGKQIDDLYDFWFTITEMTRFDKEEVHTNNNAAEYSVRIIIMLKAM